MIRERKDHSLSIMIDYDHQNWITKIYSEDEPVRHKLFDFLGDIALLGVYVNASIYVYKPHHRFNRQSVKKIYKELIKSSLR